jgi:transposase
LKRFISATRIWISTVWLSGCMRAIALGRKNYLFVGSEPGGRAAAIAYTLIETAKLNAIDPLAWLADTLAQIPDYKINKVDDLLPWRWNG